ncbi:MAG: class I SAM-dependent methyltransferase [Gemmataceae bacterium]|nr:class I SAM-dependent methyltransferase [Gemmataceae bacterium]
MRCIDRVLQRWRARMARPWIPEGACVLDIGCHQGEFLDSFGERIGPSVGFDPLTDPSASRRHRLVRDIFRAPALFPDGSFDAVVMLATLEHIRDKDPLASECWRLLRPGGRVIITVPSGFVDAIVHCLCKVRLADGMSLDEHHGYDPRTTPQVFGRYGFTLERHRRFQLGLNHLFVLGKPVAVEAETPDPAMRPEAVPMPA